MIDPFALLDEPRRPWLDGESLKSRFLLLSAESHPDRVRSANEHDKRAASERFAQLNAAYNQLLDPKTRLQILIELERGSPPGQIRIVGQDHVELFGEIGDLCRRTDKFLDGATKQISPLLRVQLLETNEALARELNNLQIRLDRMNRKLQQLNEVWDCAPPVGSASRLNALPCTRLEELYRDYGFVKRWSSQLRDRIVRLSIHLNNLLQ
jgi:DnaJ-domain-containing protein 1